MTNVIQKHKNDIFMSIFMNVSVIFIEKLGYISEHNISRHDSPMHGRHIWIYFYRKLNGEVFEGIYKE